MAALYTYRMCPVQKFGHAGTNLGHGAGRDRAETARAKEDASSAIAEGTRLAAELRAGAARAGEGQEDARNLAKAREEARNLSIRVTELEASAAAAAAAADTGGVASCGNCCDLQKFGI